ncbi:MAG: AAA family ATPase [Gammaproteobacteria bacterium]|nr:AAA family ATPase [Gammaproteobacteria bacterium]
MKFEIKNLGIIKQASLELGGLTVLCGKNNAGKTYITHTIHEFLQGVRKNHIFRLALLSQKNDLIKQGLDISFAQYRNTIEERCGKLAEIYSQKKQADLISDTHNFGVDDNAFQFSFHLDASDLQLSNSISSLSDLPENSIFSVSVDPSAKRFTLKLDPDGNGGHDLSNGADDINFSSPGIFRSMYRKKFRAREARDKVEQEITRSFIPDSFIAGAERVGSMIFQKDVDFSKSLALEILGSNPEKQLEPPIFKKINATYPFAVRDNLNFFRYLPEIAKNKGALHIAKPDIVERFQDIIGGSVKITQEGEMLFQPRDKSSPPVSYIRASGAVKNMLIIGCYLKYLASEGDLLIIDEPELGLYPENQRAVAQLIARLVNAGLQVFITTHSDYIVKEMSALIMLSQNESSIQKIREKHGYEQEVLLDIKNTKVYYMRDALESTLIDSEYGGNLDIDEHKPQVLVEADVSIEEGIEMKVFDKSINKMNEIQEEILWRRRS